MNNYRSLIINIGISAVFFLLGILATKLLEKKYQPVYSVINSPTLIYDRDNSSPNIWVTLKDSIPINENVYVTTLALWNKGKLEVKSEDVRKPFYIFCSDSIGKIIDIDIIQQNDPIESNFRLSHFGDSVKLDWDYFDSKYGCKILVIYSGHDDTKILLTGKVAGTSVKEKREQFKESKLHQLFNLIIVGLFFTIFINGFFFFLLKRASTNRKWRMGILLACSALLLLLYYLVENNWNSSIVPF
ncbi:MAG: hypothetical protein JXR56_00725 [Candidatus Cloacimonetes bacterium]|nr:hypothetical protein [Candidatus Cloacimonadota bacterium]